jgi:hypothetical protein
MGHQRLGKLPAYRMLPDIIKYLVSGGEPTADLVDQVTEVGRNALKLALKDPVFIEALWLLVRVPQAASSGAFAEGLLRLASRVRRQLRSLTCWSHMTRLSNTFSAERPLEPRT